MSDNLPEEKTLRTTSFVIHATRGVIREQTMRRKMMLGLLVIALALLVCGSTFLQSFLSPREHPGWFILFWVACGWVAVTAMLLAILDIVLVKREQRAGERDLRQGVSAQDETGS